MRIPEMTFQESVKKAEAYRNIIKPQTENHEPSDRKNGRRVNY